MKRQIKKLTAIICNISYLDHYLKGRNPNEITYPDTLELVMPESILCQQNSPNFMDIIEDFAYKMVTGIQGREVANCQIWLYEPEEEN